MPSEVRFRVDRLWPRPAADLDLDEAFADLALPAPPTGRSWLGVNMVTTIDGRATRLGGADGLAGRADRRVMRLLRGGYDAVATGVGTLRRVDFYSRIPDDFAARRAARGRPPQPTAVVVGGSGPIPTDRRFFRGDQPRLVVVGSGHGAVTDAQRLREVAEVVAAPTPRPEPGWVLETLRARGLATVLLEGGPTTNASFLAADLIDELYWTVGAALVGSDGLPMTAALPGGSRWEAEPRRGRLVSVHRAGDDLFLRYRFAGASASDAPESRR
ncbi:MAG: dihydrofolate reductase family protein [Chloroflexota bacterium]|nr:dihydrofolate reductase family protein [Chloroflexota bacterium]